MSVDWPHGDVSDAELLERGLDPTRCIDFAVNVDPRGPHPAVLKAFHRSSIHRYPDPSCRRLVRALARRDDVPPETILVGPGVAGLLWALLQAYGPGTRVLLNEPTFAEYRSASLAAGARVHAWRRSPADGFLLHAATLHDHIERFEPDLVMLANPENPTGAPLDVALLHDLALRWPRATFVADEAFLRLSDHHEYVFQRLPENVVRLRSLTKELGIPGLRVGYVHGTSERLGRIAERLPPWSVGSPALAAAEAGVSDPSIVAHARNLMRCDIETLIAGLRARGFAVLPTSTVYCLVRTGVATWWKDRLAAQGLLVRDCTSFGLPDHLRLCGRPRADQSRLLEALDALPEEGTSC